MTAAHLKVEETRTATDAVLVLTGEIDMATAGDLRAATGRTSLAAPRRAPPRRTGGARLRRRHVLRLAGAVDPDLHQP